MSMDTFLNTLLGIAVGFPFGVILVKIADFIDEVV
jgi:hypothetical protein